jgi:hypothetical protein
MPDDVSPIVIPYAPRPYQLRIHSDPARFKCIVAHRRAGKTVLFVNECIKGALACKRPEPRVHYIAPTYKQAKRIAWDYFKRFSAAIPGAKANAGELRIDYPNGGRVTLLGSDQIDSLRGIYSDGAVLDEFAMMSPRAFPEIILPALLDRDGWAMAGGTPLGANQLKRYYERARDGAEGWAGFMLKASETGAIPEHALRIARANMSDAEYAQEFECSFEAVIKGAYYGDLIAQADAQGRICDVPYNPALAVTVAVDLGFRDAFACWILQEAPSSGQIRAIDYREYTGKGLPQVKAEIDKLGYPIARWQAPHDIEVHELGTGRSRIEIARELGMPFEKAARMDLPDGIEAVRAVIPMMVFDRRRCEYGLDALRQYRTEFDEEAGVFGKNPVHDWTSHCADALRTYATSRSGATRTNWLESLGEVQEAIHQRRQARQPRRAGR